VDFYRIGLTAPLGSLMGRTTNLKGAADVAARLGTLTLDDVTGGTLSFTGAAGASGTPRLVFDQVKDTSIDSTVPLTSLTATEWLDTDGTLQEIRAPWIGTLCVTGRATGTKIAGDFAANLTLTGAGVTGTAKTLSTATIKGAVAPSAWDVTGKVGTVTISGAVGEPGDPWKLKNVTGITSLMLGDVADAVVTVTGDIGSVKAKRWIDGSIHAAKITSITTTGVLPTRTVPGISGDFGANLTLTNALAKPALGTLSISGWLDGAAVISAGPLGTVKVGGMRDSRIEAHDAGTQKSIGSFTVQGIAGQTEVFINANLSGDTLGTVVLRGVQTNNVANAGADFGVTGRKVASYTRWQGKVVAKKASNLVGAQVIEQTEDYIFQLI